MKRGLAAALGLGALLCASLWLGAQSPRGDQRGEYTLSIDVDLVVLHTTVVDDHGRIVNELGQPSFRVFEDNVEQKLSLFRNEDVPITVGLILDNSASMRENRSSMKAGALTFVETSNRMDEVFLVNFNDDYYLDLEGKDFTNSVEELKTALEKTMTRGSTSFFDAVRASLKHLKRGTRQKRVLLIVSDGVDNTSLSTFNTLLQEAQASETTLYLIGLPCAEEPRDCRRAKRQLRQLATVTGGLAYFPTSTTEVEELCRKIAHDIRNQYVLGYYPTNRARDGSFRQVRVEILSPKGYSKLYARTRSGYYAPSGGAATGAP
ncbi:MAG: VWA domain-containing protein [Candidatus Acidiferrales bacterium]